MMILITVNVNADSRGPSQRQKEECSLNNTTRHALRLFSVHETNNNTLMVVSVICRMMWGPEAGNPMATFRLIWPLKVTPPTSHGNIKIHAFYVTNAGCTLIYN